MNPVALVPVPTRSRRSRLLRSAAGLALSAAALAAHAQSFNPPVAPAPAQTSATPTGTTPTGRSALVQIVDDQAHGAFKEGVFNTCTLAGVCTVAFSTVPAGHRRLVETVSCSVYVASSGALRYVAFLANSFTAPRQFLPYSRSVADAGQYFVHAPSVFPFEPGETPLIYAYADARPIQDLTCTITGRDIVLP